MLSDVGIACFIAGIEDKLQPHKFSIGAFEFYLGDNCQTNLISPVLIFEILVLHVLLLVLHRYCWSIKPQSVQRLFVTFLCSQQPSDIICTSGYLWINNTTTLHTPHTIPVNDIYLEMFSAATDSRCIGFAPQRCRTLSKISEMTIRGRCKIKKKLK